MFSRSKYNIRSARKKGHGDGRTYNYTFWPFIKEAKASYPLLEQEEPAEYENELIDIANKEIADIAEKWKTADKKLKPQYCVAKEERDRTLKRFQEEETRVAPEEANVQKIDEERMAFQEPGIPHWLAVFFHVVLFTTEIFFNSVVFQSFGFEKIDAILSAVGIGLALTFLAYLLGKLLKKGNKSVTDSLFIYLIPAVVIFGLIAISVLRGFYMKDLEIITDIRFSISPNLAVVLFFFLNIVMFLAGTIISYGSFSKDEELRNTLKKRYKHAIKRLKDEKEDAREASEAFEKADKAYIQIRNFRQKEYERHVMAAKTIKETAEHLISVYRAANQEKRLDGKKPLCFKKEPEQIQMHQNEDLPATLDWEC